MNLRTRLQQGPIVTAAGVYDALSALLVEQAGMEAAYISGANLAYTRLGRPDIGLLSLDDVAQTTTQIRERVDLPLIVDADTGFGNAINVLRTVRLLERAGASAIQLEDQASPKRCGHLQGKVGLIERLGTETVLAVDLTAGGKIVVALDGDRPFDLGSEVLLGFEPERAHLFEAA